MFIIKPATYIEALLNTAGSNTKWPGGIRRGE